MGLKPYLLEVAPLADENEDNDDDINLKMRRRDFLKEDGGLLTMCWKFIDENNVLIKDVNSMLLVPLVIEVPCNFVCRNKEILSSKERNNN